MTWLRRLLLFSLLVSNATTIESADEVDWKKLALETNEPAFGLRIENVLPNSQAEQHGIKVGDYFVQIDEQQMRNFGVKRTREEQVIFLIRKGGELEKINVRPGLIGYHFSLVFRPWLSYLRGEIGTLSDEWDDDVVEALTKIKTEHPEIAKRRWSILRRKGYPEDELDAMIRAFLAWRSSEPVPVNEALEKVVDEFEALPMIYFAMLEDLAIASNETGILKRLHELDPASSIVTEDQIDLWNTLENQAEKPRRDLLAIARKNQSRNLVPEMVRLEGERKATQLFEDFRQHHVIGIGPGYDRRFRGKIPDDVQNFYASLTLFTDCSGHSNRWASLVRFTIDSIHKADEAPRASNILARIGIGRGQFTGPYIAASGGHNAVLRKFDDEEIDQGLFSYAPEKAIFSRQKTYTRTRNRGTPPNRLELVCIDGEAAAYFNGVCYSHLPFDPTVKDISLELHLSGMEITINDFFIREVDIP